MAMKLVKIIREKRGMTQYKLAQELGITSSGVQHYEKTARSIRLDILCRLRKIGRLSWSELGALLDKEFP